jgi:hypothetical protein
MNDTRIPKLAYKYFSLAEEIYDDQGKYGGTNIHEDGRVLGGLHPVPDDDDDDDLLKTTKEHTNNIQVRATGVTYFTFKTNSSSFHLLVRLAL